MTSRQNLYPTYQPPNIKFERGEGLWLVDDQGQKYLDFISGISVNTLGHAHPDLVRALETQAKKLWHLSNMFDVPGQASLAKRYCDLSFADRVFFGNSGSEAVECALKSARRYHYANGQPERIKIIGFEGAFHGRTYASVNAAGNPKYLEGFGPALPGYAQVPFCDFEALAQEIDDTTAAIIIEPVQGEGGLRPLPTSDLPRLRQICDEAGILLIYDEVQCGAGRTGKLFAHQWADDAAPDITATAKGVGGGFPLGMCLATEAVGREMVVGTHGTTYGGNALAVAVGHAVLNYIERESAMEHVNAMSKILHTALADLALQFPTLIESVRGKGLLCGLKLKISNIDIKKAALTQQLLIGSAGDNTIRLAPALTVSTQEIETAIARLKTVFMAQL